MKKLPYIIGFIGLAVLIVSAQSYAGIYNPPPTGSSAAGGLSAANNLSDLSASSTARTNLGLTNEKCMEPAFNIENPGSSTEDLAFWRAPATSTITKAYSVHKTTGDTVTFNFIWGTTRASSSASSRHLWASNEVSTSTHGNTFTSGFASTTVNNGAWVRAVTSAGSSTNWTFNLCYTTP